MQIAWLALDFMARKWQQITGKQGATKVMPQLVPKFTGSNKSETTTR